MSQNRQFETLLSNAERSLKAFTESSDPKDLETLRCTQSKYEAIELFYKSLRNCGGRKNHSSFPNPLPDARQLFWDHPETELQETCLNDCLKVSLFVRENEL